MAKPCRVTHHAVQACQPTQARKTTPSHGVMWIGALPSLATFIYRAQV